MKRIKYLAPLALLFLGNLPGFARDTRMTAGEFDAYTLGKTFYFGNSGTPYGAEEYLDGRRVQWSFLNGKCKSGEWFPKGDLICFVYENTDGAECWAFAKGAQGMTAQFEDGSGRPNQTELYEVRQSPEPLMCLGPEVGV